MQGEWRPDLVFSEKGRHAPHVFQNKCNIRGYSLYYKHRRVKILPKAKLKR